MRILEIHSRVNTIEEVKEVEKYFDAFYVMGIYEPTEYSWEHNKKYGLDGSLFAIEDYSWEIPEELKKIGKPIIVDFIPNHIGISTANKKFAFVDERIGDYEWADTYQINYSSRYALDRMRVALMVLVKTFDGLRFDMAHLLLQKNYNSKHRVYLGYEPLEKLIETTKQINPNCILIAEAYQDYNDLKNLGFDYVYRVEPRRNWFLFPDEKDLIIIDNHDEQLLYWYCNQDLEFLKEKLIYLTTFDNTLWYLPAIMGYTKRPSANYWYNRQWDINPKIKEIYLEVLEDA